MSWHIYSAESSLPIKGGWVVLFSFRGCCGGPKRKEKGKPNAPIPSRRRSAPKSWRMDLNLYLGLPRSPPSRSRDLGSDLSLNSLPWSSPTTTVEERGSSIPMSGAVEPSESHPPYSPSHEEYNPELPVALPEDSDGTPDPPYYPSFGRYWQFGLSPEPEGADASYSPPILHSLPAAQDTEERSVQDVNPQTLYDPTSPPTFPYAAVAYLPPYFTGSTSSQEHETASFSLYPALSSPTREFLPVEGGTSSQPELLRPSDSCFRRFLDTSHRRPNRRFRSTLLQVGERFSFGSPSLPNTELPVPDVVISQRPSECNGKHKVKTENTPADASEEEGEDKGRNVANFECNICFDMAGEPVVTSCGHLFCWPCLYQWLHVHSEHKECPVCKGEVNESNITPIYGRGSSQSSAEKKCAEDGDSALKIPPRPSGNRLESFRQQFWPVSRRLGEGIAATWRRFLDQHLHTGSRYESHADPNLQELYENVQRRALIRLRARRLQRDMNSEGGSIAGDLGQPANNVPNPNRSTTDSIFRDGVDLWHQFMHERGTDRLTSIAADFERVVGRLNRNDGNGASTSVDPPTTEALTSRPLAEVALSADQVSASSTMAVIQGDVVTSEAPAEPQSVGSSPNRRRRGRSSTSGSYDVDGGTLHSFKRRRLN
ncbi:uncharacterized protein LOC121989362 isoform X1 [Zingiber officinale]|uniref:E3 ubiquitin-protein ligase RMA n=1 Tax=Zingiber officinale TaxID=94328 RepID=A0A8J5KYQ5_ZINOF|nr:uncharacterized protein LOC121989362 isoform X1 [Zingiber officinale]KAG6497937.1 hypothetical protein ZIOFF_045843 [Zingiber officinale]